MRRLHLFFDVLISLGLCRCEKSPHFAWVGAVGPSPCTLRIPLFYDVLHNLFAARFIPSEMPGTLALHAARVLFRYLVSTVITVVDTHIYREG